MKNVHVLPTEKPSRLYSWEELRIGDSVIRPTHLGMFNQYIYITDDSEIKVGDWCLVLSSKKEYLIEKYSFHSDCIIAKKIILTTDPDLIAYGVQSIDDEFLEWFVKNQSCESVQVEKVEGRYVDYRGNVHTPISYEIIIPKEAPKQENCCTPTGQIKRYKDCIGCDRKPKQENTETFKQNRMAKVTIEFDSIEEQHELDVCMNGGKWYTLVWDLDQYLRGRLKYEPMSDKEYEVLQQTRDKLHELRSENGLSFD